jgi:hypothetical protein
MKLFLDTTNLNERGRSASWGIGNGDMGAEMVSTEPARVWRPLMRNGMMAAPGAG